MRTADVCPCAHCIWLGADADPPLHIGRALPVTQNPYGIPPTGDGGVPCQPPERKRSRRSLNTVSPRNRAVDLRVLEVK